MTRSLMSATVGLAVALTGCADPATTKRVADLEEKVAKIEEQLEKGGGAAAAGAEAGQEKEQEAMGLYREANDAVRAGDTAKAKELLTKLKGEFGGTRVATAAERLMDQLSVVGKEISEIKVEEWYVGTAGLSDGKATLLVFWEVWCPHCKREVPKLQATYDKYKGEGLNLIGLTKLTRGKTVEDVKAFVAEEGVKYPMGKEAGDMSDFFGVSGVPAAAVVKDGKVVWRGHPAQINDDMIKDWIGS